MSDHLAKARDKAEQRFAKIQQRAAEGEKAMQEYVAEGQAQREKTERLRALRLAKEEAEAAALAAAPKVVKPKARKKKVVAPS